MKYVTIPNTELRVSQMCLGSAEFGAGLTSKDAFSLLDAFIAEGGKQAHLSTVDVLIPTGRVTARHHVAA